MRRGDAGFLQPLQAFEFPQRGTAAKEPTEAIAVIPDRIEFQVVGFAFVFESPDLAVPAVFHQSAELRQIAEDVFKVGIRH
jgi:hypothetical protein